MQLLLTMSTYAPIANLPPRRQHTRCTLLAVDRPAILLRRRRQEAWALEEHGTWPLRDGNLPASAGGRQNRTLGERQDRIYHRTSETIARLLIDENCAGMANAERTGGER